MNVSISDTTGDLRKKKSIRYVLIVLIVVCLTVFLYIYQIRSIEAGIAKRVIELGGFAFYDEEVDAGSRSWIFPRLRAVAFYKQSQVEDQDIIMLQELSALEEVFFGHVPITDEGLVHISKLTNLKGLQLPATKITDAGLSSLTDLKKLKFLDIKENALSQAAITSLERALPKCRIENGLFCQDSAISAPLREAFPPAENCC